MTGILGAIALILAFIGFGSLPLNVAGLLLIGLAILLFVLEFTVTSHGLLTVAGLACFVLGAFALYTAPGTPTAPDVSVATPLIVLMAAATAAFMSSRSSPSSGSGGGVWPTQGPTGLAARRPCRAEATRWSGRHWHRSGSSTPRVRNGRPGRAAERRSHQANASASSARKGLRSSSSRGSAGGAIEETGAA